MRLSFGVAAVMFALATVTATAQQSPRPLGQTGPSSVTVDCGRMSFQGQINRPPTSSAGWTVSMVGGQFGGEAEFVQAVVLNLSNGVFLQCTYQKGNYGVSFNKRRPAPEGYTNCSVGSPNFIFVCRRMMGRMSVPSQQLPQQPNASPTLQQSSPLRR